MIRSRRPGTATERARAASSPSASWGWRGGGAPCRAVASEPGDPVTSAAPRAARRVAPSVTPNAEPGNRRVTVGATSRWSQARTRSAPAPTAAPSTTASGGVRRRQQPLEQQPDPQEPQGQGGVGLGLQPAQVEAGGEVPRSAAQHQRPGSRDLGLVERRVQLLDQGGGQRIGPLGSCQGERPDRLRG